MSKVETAVLLKDLKGRTEFCIKEAKKLLKVKDSRLNDCPNPETWSAAQCVDHLNQYGDFYLPEITQAINKSSNAPIHVFSPGFIGNMFAKAMLPNAKTTKMQAPADKSPSKDELDHEVINTFIEQQKQYLEILKEAESVNLNKVKVKVTISKWVKLKLGDALRVTIYHNERHIKQALNVLKNK